MKSEELSRKLEQQEKEILSLSRMDDLHNRVQTIMPEAISDWLDTEVDRRIKKNAETIQSLGLEKLREFKSKLNALKKELPNLVNEEFSNQDNWSHNIENEESARNTRSELQLNQFFRTIISKLGPILSEYNLIEEPKGYIQTWKQINQNEFRYEINFGTTSFESEIKDYSNLFKEYSLLKAEMENKRKELSEAKAKELWDEA